MTKRLLLGLLPLVFVGQTVYFGRVTLAAIHEWRGQRAFLRNDLVAAWERTGQALEAGGAQGRLETRRIEILLAGLNRRDLGLKVDLPLEETAAGEEARRLIARRLRETPHVATLWSRASEFFFHEGQVLRRTTAIDLSRLSDDPMENLFPPDRLGLAALEKAASLEPDNYLYHDLLTEQFLEFGSDAHAAPECRRAVACYPRLSAHHYLSRTDLPPVIVQGALDGYQDALLTVSLVARVEILRDAGRLLSGHGRDEQAVRFFEAAARLDPGYFDAHYDLAKARIRLGDWKQADRDLERAVAVLPDYAPAYVLVGRVKWNLGDGEGAIQAYRRARALGSTDTRIFTDLGEVFESLNRMTEARRQYIAAVNLNPTDPAAWAGLLGYARRHGERSEALRACARLLASPDARDSVRRDCAAVSDER